MIFLFLLFNDESFNRVYAAPVKIMPLGNSITGSPGCWRCILWNELQDNGYTDIDFVGTLPPQGCGEPYDGDNEGHGGALATTVANENQLPGWLSSTNPDIVLMHFGTNDVWSAKGTSVIIDAFSTLVDQMRANNPNMIILVAQIIPMDSDRSCSSCYQGVIDLNNAILGWASGKSTSQSPIIVVDQWTGFSEINDTYDGVHPNDNGDKKISDKWYSALTSVLSGTVISTDNLSVSSNIGIKVNTSFSGDSARISFGVHNSGFVDIAVHSLAGKKIASLVNRQYNAGNYIYEFIISSFPNGIYVCRMAVNGMQKVSFMQIMR